MLIGNGRRIERTSSSSLVLFVSAAAAKFVSDCETCSCVSKPVCFQARALARRVFYSWERQRFTLYNIDEDENIISAGLTYLYKSIR